MNEHSPWWWQNKQFLVATAISVVGVALTLPSILPKISVTYDGAGPNQNVATFKVSNDGIIGLNDVSCICKFIKLIYPNPNVKAENNSVDFQKKMDSIPPGGTAVLICPLPIKLGQAPISGLLGVSINYRPDFAWFHRTTMRHFESAADILHWTPPHLF